MQNKTYWWLKHVFVGPLLWVYNRPFNRGIDKIPSEGAAILASNHLAVISQSPSDEMVTATSTETPTIVRSKLSVACNRIAIMPT